MSEKDRFFWLYFRFSGRVNRAAYFLAGMLIAVLQAFPLYRFMLVPEDSSEGRMWAFAFSAMFVVSLWSSVALGVKRLHDIDRPGVLSVALFVPVISIIAFIALCLIPGTQGPNRYGRSTNEPSGA